MLSYSDRTFNRTQTLLVAFLAMAWLSLIVILAIAPEIYDEVLRLPPGVRLASLAALSAFIAVVILGVLKRWRWTFWLLLVQVTRNRTAQCCLVLNKQHPAMVHHPRLSRRMTMTHSKSGPNRSTRAQQRQAEPQTMLTIS
jgi:hypothetical protein